jgi:hypothetical protein
MESSRTPASSRGSGTFKMQGSLPPLEGRLVQQAGPTPRAERSRGSPEGIRGKGTWAVTREECPHRKESSRCAPKGSGNPSKGRRALGSVASATEHRADCVSNVHRAACAFRSNQAEQTFPPTWSSRPVSNGSEKPIFSSRNVRGSRSPTDRHAFLHSHRLHVPTSASALAKLHPSRASVRGISCFLAARPTLTELSGALSMEPH